MRVLTGMPAGVVGIEAGGKLSAKDYAKVLAPALPAATKDRGKIRIVLSSSGGEQEEAVVWAAATSEKP